jgi:site-specific recombinase XerD
MYGTYVIEVRWRVHLTRRDLPWPAVPQPFLRELPEDLDGWLDAAAIPEGMPFLLSPSLDYDVRLNAFFRGPRMVAAPQNTRLGYARDIAAFLNFLWSARGGRSWREATEADHVAYLVWRRRDERGPRVAGATWNREVALVNQFYRWATRRGYVAENPVAQRDRRPVPVEAGRAPATEQGTVPAAYAHDAAAGRVVWLPPAAYRRWRDVGVRGYRADGLPDEGFRGRWAARNAVFTDLLVRTGLRLSEQAALSVFEVPLTSGDGGYQRFWLPGAVAKNHSARWVYVPASLVGELAAYARFDRAEVAGQARAAGRYRQLRRPLVVEDPSTPVAVQAGGGGRRVPVGQLGPAERRRLLVETTSGLEPALFWLGEDGMPLAVSTWKAMFADANARCRRQGLEVSAHAHALRHSFAVVTLEQLQRGHLAALGALTAEQRGHYTRVFGDPLDWVRRRLGHRSALTTTIYLHALAELEMETRMALVPDSWEDPRETPLVLVAGEAPPAGGGGG